MKEIFIVVKNYIYTNFSKAYAKLDEMKNEVFDLMNAKRHNIL